MSVAKLSVEIGVPGPARQLIWDSFFVKERRGVAFEDHLPWYANPDTRSVIVHSSLDDIVGAAIIRPARQMGVAMIGFVCVDKLKRGQGYGRDLVAAVNVVVRELGYHTALLWTGLPSVYHRSGYDQIGQDIFLKVKERSGGQPVGLPITVEPWPGYSDQEGLPAFALSARRLRSNRGEAIVAEGPRGITLIDWQGAPEDIVKTMSAAGYRSWGVNIPSGSKFLEALPTDQFVTEATKGPVAMAYRSDVTVAIEHVPVAHRI